MHDVARTNADFFSERDLHIKTKNRGEDGRADEPAAGLTYGPKDLDILRMPLESGIRAEMATDGCTD